MNDEGALQDAPDTFTITRRKPYQPSTTHLQDVLAELAAVFEQRDECLEILGRHAYSACAAAGTR